MSGLTPPVSESDHRSGSDKASAVLLEYGDYECPHCAAAHPIVKEVRRRMERRLRFVFRHFPLSEMHPHAERAAEAAEAAAAREKFWEMHDSLFEDQQALADEDLLARARLLGLDEERFAAELASGTYEPRVRLDFRSGIRSGVNGTPTFFINGLRYDGFVDPDLLIEALEAAAEA